MMMKKREEAKLLIARQIAIADQCVWQRLLPKSQAHYLTLAENILATVERKMVDWRWE